MGVACSRQTFEHLWLSRQRSFPYISAMVNNGSVSYDHGKDGRFSELGGCSAEIRNREHDTYLAIRYSKGRLTVRGPLSARTSVGGQMHRDSLLTDSR